MTKKTQFFCLCIAFVSALAPSWVFADALTDEQAGLISQNCASIRTRLNSIKKQDARNRVSIGNYYESISTGLVMRLSSRFSKNSISTTSLSRQQKLINTSRDKFRLDFVSYSQSFESLEAIDCQKNPDLFYAQLLSVRSKRAILYDDMQEIRIYISDHRNYVSDYKEKL